MGFTSTIAKHKWLILVGALCTGFTIATIVLAVEVARLNGLIGDDMTTTEDPGTSTESSTTEVTTTELPQEPWEADYRLPENILPLSYDLLLHPDLDTATFTGRVTIQIETLEAMDYILVHQKYLTITSTTLDHLHAEERHPIDVEGFDSLKNEFWVVTPKAGDPAFAVGTFDLTLEFNGFLNGSIVGFYESKYTENGVNRTIATSKFQPTYARQAFPCFDEPSFKSKFTVHLVRPTGDGYNALSNMNIENEVDDTPTTGLTTVNFAESVPMVTYLACFIVSDFLSERQVDISVPTTDGETHEFPLNVYATPGQSAAKKTEYALDTGESVVKYYIEYFDIGYPLPKLDMIAIPDFVSGAMEHWGLITFRETSLLYSDSVSSVVNKQRVAVVVAHELAHMWFGNLVTLKWWDDLWLNEGFASYMEFKGVDKAEPTWQMTEQFLIEDLHPVLKLDAVLSSHPIVQTVGHPDQITELFDTISYSKGASVIRMLEDFLGPDEFQTGIHNFLDKFKFANAVTQDLWDALQEVAPANVNVTETMDTWTRQMGFPVVHVKKVGANYHLTQERFLADPEADLSEETSPFNYTWEIPISYITSENADAVQDGHKTWMKLTGEPITVPVPAGDWVKFNFHQIGYYRVNYEESHWKALVDNILDMNVPDRAHLMDDAFSLADAGVLPNHDIALDLTKYLIGEDGYIPWSVASSKLNSLRSILADSLGFKNLRTYVHGLLNDRYDVVTWDVDELDGHLDRRLRMTILDLACSMGHKKCMEDVGGKFNVWITGDTNDRPHPDLRSLIYYHGLGSASSEENWDKMWELYKTESDAQEKIKLMYGLAAVNEPWLLRRYLQLAKDESNVRSQDYFTVLTYISGNPIGTPIVWDFVRAEWDYLVERFTLNDRYLGRLIPSITSSFTTKFKLQEMEAFFALYPEAGAGAVARAQALETVANRIKWLERNEQAVIDWLARSQK